MPRCLIISFWAFAQTLQSAVSPMPIGEIQQSIRKLDTLASVLYIAAHPDDENTRLIAYMANKVQADTTYLSLTRGDGGQNLLGDDLGYKLGIIRTQELLAARRIDGGSQRFSRANDFGYSKSPVESFEIWGRGTVLADTVWAIRSLRPDVVINRFSILPGFTHGHHTASAQIAVEAFEAAANPEKFPEQLEWVEPWQAKRLVWNTSSWFYRRRGEDFDPRGKIGVDTGEYNAALGMAYSEIASLSRSEHKSQGFGSTPTLGESIEYLDHVAGQPAEGDLFSDIDITWGRVEGSTDVATLVQGIQESFNTNDPSASVPDLIRLYRLIEALPESFWRARKLEDVRLLIFACIGLDVEWTTSVGQGVPGATIQGQVSAVQRSSMNVSLIGIDVQNTIELSDNRLVRALMNIEVPAEIENSQPYWLREPSEYGAYTVGDQEMIGLPEGSPLISRTLEVIIEGENFPIPLSPMLKYNDPVAGEVKEPFVVVPPAVINLDEDLHIVSEPMPIDVAATVKIWSNDVSGTLKFETDSGWMVSPQEIPFKGNQGEELNFEVKWKPSSQAGRSQLKAELVIGDETVDVGYERLEYRHIPVQTLFPQAQAQGILLDVATYGDHIAYIDGAGDAIPEALQRMGYTVDVLDEQSVISTNLMQYDAIILGIRALNTVDRIGFMMPALKDYARKGGVLVLQYNTSFRLKTRDFSPFELELSRDRVTNEFAAVEVLDPEHPVLNFPNKIQSSDFDGWVQERGLYFPSSWGPEFTPIFSIADPDERPSEGSLLIAEYGEGYYVYTGLSWFRQLPAGVSGAYRIFANIVSLGGAKQ